MIQTERSAASVSAGGWNTRQRDPDYLRERDFSKWLQSLTLAAETGDSDRAKFCADELRRLFREGRK